MLPNTTTRVKGGHDYYSQGIHICMHFDGGQGKIRGRA